MPQPPPPKKKKFWPSTGLDWFSTALLRWQALACSSTFTLSMRPLQSGHSIFAVSGSLLVDETSMTLELFWWKRWRCFLSAIVTENTLSQSWHCNLGALLVSCQCYISFSPSSLAYSHKLSTVYPWQCFQTSLRLASEEGYRKNAPLSEPPIW